MQSYSEIREKCDDTNEVKENLAKIFTKLEKIQNLSESVLTNLKECKEKIFKGEKFKVFNSKMKSGNGYSSSRSSKYGSKRGSRSSSKERGLPPKRSHNKIDMEKIDEEINEAQEENKIELLAERKKSNKKIEKSKSKDKKRKRKNSSSESDVDNDSSND